MTALCIKTAECIIEVSSQGELAAPQGKQPSDRHWISPTTGSTQQGESNFEIDCFGEEHPRN